MKRIIFVVACVAIGIVGAAACGGAPRPPDVPGTRPAAAAVPEAPSAFPRPPPPEAPRLLNRHKPASQIPCR